MSRNDAEKLIDEIEVIFTAFGMDGPVYPTDIQAANAIQKNAKKYGVDLLLIRQKHLGSETLPGHISKMTDFLLSRGVTIHTREDAIDVVVKKGRVQGLRTSKAEYRAPNIILAPGRVGADWVGGIAEKPGASSFFMGGSASSRRRSENSQLLWSQQNSR